MQNFLELSQAVQSNLNILDEKTEKWSVQVTMLKRGKEADAPGMFMSINAKETAAEVFTCTLDADATVQTLGAMVAPKSSDGPGEQTIVVVRSEKRCVEGAVAVKEYLARCRVHKLVHKCKIDGVGFSVGDFLIRIGRVENMQGTYAGTVVEIEYGPLRDLAQAEAVLEEYAKHVQEVMAAVGEGGVKIEGGDQLNGGGSRGGNGGELVAVPTDVLRMYDLANRPFSDAHLAILYVHTIMTMQ